MIPQQSQDIYSHLVISNYIPVHTILIIKHLASFYFVDDYFYHGFCYYDASEILVRIFLVLRTPGIVYDIQVAMTDALSEPRRKELVKKPYNTCMTITSVVNSIIIVIHCCSTCTQVPRFSFQEKKISGLNGDRTHTLTSLV